MADDRYAIRISESVDRKMAGWNLPESVQQSVLSRLRDELATNPVQHLVSCIAPWGEWLNLYSFSVPDGGVLHSFQFYIRYADDDSENVLLVHDCGYTLPSRDVSGPPLPSEP